MLSSALKQWALKRNQGEFLLPDRKEVVNRLLKCFSSKQEPTSDGSKTVISPSAESVDVDSQPMPPSEDESCGASSEAHTTPADTVGVVNAHVIPGNLCPAQPVITSQLSDSSHSPDSDDSGIPLPQPKLNSVAKLAQKPGQDIRFKGRHGEVYDPSYSDTLIPVLHHGAVSGGIDKCDLCHFHLKGNCRRGSRCTYAHSWAEKIE